MSTQVERLGWFAVKYFFNCSKKHSIALNIFSSVGLDEAGIDGGGLFREFLSQLLRAAFDPNRGFFVLTKDQMLYPNPTADQIHGDSSPHYYFIGQTQNIGIGRINAY